MRYLFILFLFLIPNICFGTFQPGINICNHYIIPDVDTDNRYIIPDVAICNHYDFSVKFSSLEFYNKSFRSNSTILFPHRYINDLGHEFSIEFFPLGIYWKSGAWGYKNGFNRFYTDIYHFNKYCRPEVNQDIVCQSTVNHV